MNTPIYRRARPQECSHLVRMVRELASDSNAPLVPAATAEDFARHGFGAGAVLRLHVVEIDGEVVGCLVGEVLFSTWRGALGLYVCDLHIDRAHRNRGLGADLLAHAIQDAPDGGYGFVKLEVAHDNAGALRFYERLGFREKPGETVLVLERASRQPGPSPA